MSNGFVLTQNETLFMARNLKGASEMFGYESFLTVDGGQILVTLLADYHFIQANLVCIPTG